MYYLIYISSNFGKRLSNPDKSRKKNPNSDVVVATNYNLDRKFRKIGLGWVKIRTESKVVRTSPVGSSLCPNKLLGHASHVDIKNRFVQKTQSYGQLSRMSNFNKRD